ncbi:MAG: hypothetical protein M0R38_04285 [Bacteroidia bacterium]|nr:hypothetical protein [Bacteroidia bacterium]
MKFKELAIAQLIVDRLTNLGKINKIPHAILFSGHEGSGNLATAIAFSQYILCDNPTENDSCGECPNCKKVSEYIHPDIFFSFPFISAKDQELSTAFIEEWRNMLKSTPYPSLQDWQQSIESNNKQLNIYASEIRDIAKRLSLKSYSGKKKILILWLPEFMGKEGNMLLKLIEEPPDHTLFFLVTESEKDILTTILSRAQRIYIPKPDVESIAQYLLSIDDELTKEKAGSIALAAKGNVNEALAIHYEQEEPFFELFRTWLLACYTGKGSTMMEQVEKINKGSRDNVVNFLSYGLELMRDVFIFTHNSLDQNLPEKEKEFLTNFAKTMEGRSFEDMYKLFNETIFGIIRNGNINILLTSLSMDINKIFKGKRIIKAEYGMQ